MMFSESVTCAIRSESTVGTPQSLKLVYSSADHPAPLVRNRRPSGRKRTHRTVSAGATAVMRTVSLSAIESTQRKRRPTAMSPPPGDRKSGGEGKRGEFGGRRNIKKKKKKKRGRPGGWGKHKKKKNVREA